MKLEVDMEELESVISQRNKYRGLLVIARRAIQMMIKTKDADRGSLELSIELSRALHETRIKHENI